MQAAGRRAGTARVEAPRCARRDVPRRFVPRRPWLVPLVLGLTATLGGCAITIGEGDFFHDAKTTWPVADIDPTFQRTVVEVRHADGNVSRGVRLFSPHARGTILFFQGNGETVDREGATRLRQFERLNMNAVILDRRGYGQTPGQPTVALLASDALEVFDQVRADTRGRLVVHGFSLGTSIAGIVARDRAVDALVIEGGTPNVAEYVHVHIPWYVLPFVRLRVADSLAATGTSRALADFSGPLLIAVGENDPDTVPALSRRLYESLNDRQKELAVVPLAGHSALTTPAGALVYGAFLDRVLR